MSIRLKLQTLHICFYAALNRSRKVVNVPTGILRINDMKSTTSALLSSVGTTTSSVKMFSSRCLTKTYLSGLDA